LAYGVGAGADMLRPLAIAIIGALVISLLLSLIVTPVFYYVMARLLHVENRPEATPPTIHWTVAFFRRLRRVLKIGPRPAPPAPSTERESTE
jgi:uncharacterized membrane protein